MSERRHVAPRELLERVDRRLLARFLSPHEGWLAAHGIQLDALAKTHQDDRALVHRLHDLVNGEGGAPEKLLEDAAAVVSVANKQACEEAFRLDEEEKLPRGRLPPEDVAFLLFLDHKDLFAAVRPVSSPAGARGYGECLPKDARTFPTDGKVLGRVESELGAELERRNRSRLCNIHVFETRREIALDVVYGKPPAAKDRVVDGGEAKPRLEQETRVNTERARVVVTRATGRIAIAGYPFMKELLRRYLGEILFGDPSFYESRALLTFEPMKKDLDGALAHADVPGLAAIALRSITFEGSSGPGPTFPAGRAGDVRSGPYAALLRQCLEIEGRIVKVTLALKLEGRARFATVHARVSDAHLEFDRGDAELEVVLRDWLVRRGMLDMPALGEAAAR